MEQVSIAQLSEVAHSVSIVDVREVDEFRGGHLPGALHMPLATVPLRMSELDRSARHYIVCQAGGRSAQACMYLAEQGFDVVNVAGGTGDWIAAGLPVQTGD